MNQMLTDFIGKSVLGNIWSTAIGGGMIWSNVAAVATLLSHGPTVGQVLSAPEFQALVAGVIGVVSKMDHPALPQLSFKS